MSNNESFFTIQAVVTYSLYSLPKISIVVALRKVLGELLDDITELGLKRR